FVMIWDCMSSFSIGKYCKIDGRMDGELYREILGDEFLRILSLIDTMSQQVKDVLKANGDIQDDNSFVKKN
ncbi:17689_t:CDS:2, partial [Funneliformis geosporum]